MTDSLEKHAGAPAEGAPASNRWNSTRAAILIAAVVVVWFVFDRVTKVHFDEHIPGVTLGGPYAGLFEFVVVHNTGAAWGIFDGSTFLLGIMSVVVSIAAAIFAIVFAKRSNWLFSLGVALVVAGGLGNAFDRFMLGYVVDFINLTFIDFPVFNIADIGVTCGFALAAIAFLFFWKTPEEQQKADA